MKEGRNLRDLAVEIQRQADAKADYIADARALRYVGGQNLVELRGPRVEVIGAFEPTTLAHEQIAARLGIHKPYYDRMLLNAPGLLAENINHWLQASDSRFMVRTLDTKMRALLSSRFRPLDYIDLAKASLPTLKEAGAKVVSCEVTETRLYIKALLPSVELEVKVGDVVQSGVVISDSEVGLGKVRVEPWALRKVCANGMCLPDHGLFKAHVGRNNAEDLEGAAEFFRDETRMADDRAFWMKVQDVIRATLDPEKFRTVVMKKFRDSTKRSLGEQPDVVVENVTKRFGLTEGESSSVLRFLIEGGDLSAWGLANAVTATAGDAGGYDRATELERLGGTIIDLEPTEWKTLIASEN